MAAMTAHDYDRHVERALGPDRLDRYLRACSDDVTAALRLYEWNCAVSSALFEVLGDVEVVVRQALHRELSEWHKSKGFPGEWYDNAHGLLTPRAVTEIASARRRLKSRNLHETPSSLIPELPFGFWRFLLTRTYAPTIWRISGRKAFPNVGPNEASALWASMGRLHRLRNLIAHHEPVFWRQLDLDYKDSMWVLNATSFVIPSWSDGRSRFTAILAMRPR